MTKRLKELLLEGKIVGVSFVSNEKHIYKVIDIKEGQKSTLLEVMELGCDGGRCPYEGTESCYIPLNLSLNDVVYQRKSP